MAGAYSITITAVDKATATFDGINKRVEAFNKHVAMARAPFDRLEASFSKFTKITGLDKIATGFSSVARAGTETFRSVLRVVEPLAAVTSAASIAGLYRLATAWGSFGTQLGQQATRAGMAADRLQTLQGAARLAGVSADTLTQGMTGLNDNLRNAAFGGAPQFIQALQALGIQYDDIKSKSPEEALKILSDKLGGIKSPTDRAMAATALFGSAGEALLPLLTKGSGGIKLLAGEAEKLTGTLGQDGVDAANNFRMSQERVWLAVEGLGYAISAKLGPAIGPLLDQLANWIASNRDLVATKVGDAVKAIGDALAAVDWKAVGADVVAISHGVVEMGAAFLHAVEWADKIGGPFAALGLVLSTKLLVPLSGIASRLALLAAFSPPAWVLAALGMGAVAVKGALDDAAKVAAEHNGGTVDRSTGSDVEMSNSDLFGRDVGPDGRPAQGFFERNGLGFIPRLFGGGTGGGGGKTVPLPTGEKEALTKQAMNFYMTHGETPEAAAGITAGLLTESGMNKGAQGDKVNGVYTAYGLEQAHPDRQAHFAALFGHTMQEGTFEEQLRFKQMELHGQGGDAGSETAGQVMRTKGVTAFEAGKADAIYAERPADKVGEGQRRGELAERLLKQYGPGAAVTPPPAVDPVSKPAAKPELVATTAAPRKVAVAPPNKPELVAAVSVPASANAPIAAVAPPVKPEPRNVAAQKAVMPADKPAPAVALSDDKPSSNPGGNIAAAPSGEPVSPPPALGGAAGTPGANGQVDMNIRVEGAAQVTSKATGDVNVATSGLAIGSI